MLKLRILKTLKHDFCVTTSSPSTAQVVFRSELSGEPILIRYPNINDAPKMCEYINEISREKTFILYQGEQISEMEETVFLDGELTKIENHRAVLLLVFAGENADKLIGIGNINLQEKVERHLGLLGMSISQEYRGKGLGALLLKNLLTQAEKHLPELRLIRLTVFGNNPVAKKLYEKHGFIEYGRLPGGIRHQDVFVDSILMYKSM